jgi:hypothetical protein
VRSITLLAVAALLLGCGARSGQLSTRDRSAAVPRTLPAPVAVPPGLQATLLATVPQATFGPYIGASGDRRLVVWAEPEPHGRAFLAVVLGPGGRPAADPKRLSEAPNQIGLAAVRPAGRDGFLLAFTHRTGAGEVLSVGRIGPSGELIGTLREVAVSPRGYLWVDAAPTASGTLVLWAEPGQGEADLMVRALDLRGKPQGEPHLVLAGVLAWQAAGLPDGVAVGAVKRNVEPDRGVVVAQRIDALGFPAAEATLVSASPTARPDLDVARHAGGIVLAWSDVRDFDSSVYLAGLDAAGAVVSPPARATRGIGGEAFVRLVPASDGSERAYAVWEPLGDRPAEGRSLLVAPLAGRAALADARVTLALASDTDLPELAATRRGLHVLTLARPCPRGATACAADEPLPFLAELGPDLEVRGAEPLLLAAVGGQPATAAWSMSCTARDCVALAAPAATPTPLYAVHLVTRSQSWQPPVQPVAPPEPPFATAQRPVAATAPLSDIALARLGESRLVSWLTYFDPSTPYERPAVPAPDGRWAPVRAELLVTRIAGSELAPPSTISYRAHSLGGVALSASTTEDEALLAWSALDGGKTQVFLTLLGPDGEKKSQQMLTRWASEVSDIALARVSDGWIVGWIDERTKDPEVYLRRVTRTLRGDGPEQRITATPGAATGLALLGNEDRVFAVWADARDPQQPGYADIYATRVQAKDGLPLGEPQRLAASAGHAFAPVLALRDGNVVVGWLEGTSADGSPAPGVVVAELDGQARFVAPPTRIVTQGVPGSLALDCPAECRMVVSVSLGGRVELQAAAFEPGEKPELRRLAALEGPGGQLVGTLLDGGSLLLAAHPTETTAEARLLSLMW